MGRSPTNSSGPPVRARANPRKVTKTRATTNSRIRGRSHTNPRQQFQPKPAPPQDPRKRSGANINATTSTHEVIVEPGRLINPPVPSNPRTAFRDQKATFISSSVPGGLNPQAARPWRQSDQVKITNSDLNKKLRSASDAPAPSTEKLKHISSYPDRTGTHSFISTNEPFQVIFLCLLSCWLFPGCSTFLVFFLYFILILQCTPIGNLQ